MSQRLLQALAVAALFACVAVIGSHAEPNPRSGASAPQRPLKPPTAFAGIVDRSERSVAIFREAGRVIESPRCQNCHPVQRMPTQGDDLHPHSPYMQAGAEGHGQPGLACNTCHQAANVSTQGASIASIPGHPHWALAPASMAWQGKTLGEICRQIKDPARNGGRDLRKIHEHMAADTLVGWAWAPGPGRASAPGTQQEFGLLVAAWIASGAACPPR